MNVRKTGLVVALFAALTMGASMLVSPEVKNCTTGDIDSVVCTEPRPGLLYDLLPPNLEHLSAWLALASLGLFLGLMAFVYFAHRTATRAESQGRHVKH